MLFSSDARAQSLAAATIDLNDPVACRRYLSRMGWAVDTLDVWQLQDIIDRAVEYRRTLRSAA